MDAETERCLAEIALAREYIVNGGTDFGALMSVGDWGVEMAILDGKFHVVETKVKRCGCLVRLFRRPGESIEEFELRGLCPRCEALAGRHAIADGKRTVDTDDASTDALEDK